MYKLKSLLFCLCAISFSAFSEQSSDLLPKNCRIGNTSVMYGTTEIIVNACEGQIARNKNGKEEFKSTWQKSVVPINSEKYAISYDYLDANGRFFSGQNGIATLGIPNSFQNKFLKIVTMMDVSDKGDEIPKLVAIDGNVSVFYLLKKTTSGEFVLKLDTSVMDAYNGDSVAYNGKSQTFKIKLDEKKEIKLPSGDLFKVTIAKK